MAPACASKRGLLYITRRGDDKCLCFVLGRYFLTFTDFFVGGLCHSESSITGASQPNLVFDCCCGCFIHATERNLRLGT